MFWVGKNYGIYLVKPDEEELKNLGKQNMWKILD